MDRLLLIILMGLTVLGCDSPRASLPPRRIDTTTPEGQFDWIMQRLERVVLDFSSGERSGLRIGKRTLDHELFPPNDEISYYTAKVTVSSEKGYVPEKPLPLIDKEEIKEKRRRAMRRFNKQAGLEDEEEEFFDPIKKRFDTEMEDIAARRGGPIQSSVDIETPVLTDVAVYELAYQDDRWQLQTELETEYEQLWFEYALGPEASD